jgi:phosphatidylglycerol---prolipoprotein diacylglyceryl transferase
LIPYRAQPAFTVFGLTFYAFGFLAATALLLGWRMIVARARRDGLDADRASRLTLVVLACGFYGSHILFLLCFQTADLQHRPWRLLNPIDGIYSFGGIAAGLAALMWLAPRHGMTRERLWRYLDVVAFVFPFAWAIARTGCFLAHDHPGRYSSSWIAVDFPSGARLDLGLIEALFAAGVALCFLLLDRQRRPAPFFCGALLFAYGPFRVWLDTLHVDSVPADRWFGWGAAATGAAMLWLAGRRGLSAGTGSGSSPSAHPGCPPGSARSGRTAR